MSLSRCAAIVLAGPGIGERETRLVHWARSAYTPVLRLAERRTGLTALVTLALFGGQDASAHASYRKAQFRPYLTDVSTSLVL